MIYGLILPYLVIFIISFWRNLGRAPLEDWLNLGSSPSNECLNLVPLPQNHSPPVVISEWSLNVSQYLSYHSVTINKYYTDIINLVVK